MSNVTTNFNPGDLVLADVREPGGPVGPVAAELQAIVLHGGRYEVDVMISPSEVADEEQRADIDEMLRHCDLTLADLKEGPVYVLRNMAVEDLHLVRSAS